MWKLGTDLLSVSSYQAMMLGTLVGGLRFIKPLQRSSTQKYQANGVIVTGMPHVYKFEYMHDTYTYVGIHARTRRATGK
jgi:hypothetical protein